MCCWWRSHEGKKRSVEEGHNGLAQVTNERYQSYRLYKTSRDAYLRLILETESWLTELGTFFVRLLLLTWYGVFVFTMFPYEQSM
jgi:hypothetical protein